MFSRDISSTTGYGDARENDTCTKDPLCVLGDDGFPLYSEPEVEHVLTLTEYLEKRLKGGAND